jgi:hypothetical protein
MAADPRRIDCTFLCGACNLDPDPVDPSRRWIRWVKDDSPEVLGNHGSGAVCGRSNTPRSLQSSVIDSCLVIVRVSRQRFGCIRQRTECEIQLWKSRGRVPGLAAQAKPNLPSPATLDTSNLSRKSLRFSFFSDTVACHLRHDLAGESDDVRAPTDSSRMDPSLLMSPPSMS